MLPTLAFAGALGFDYYQHRHGRPTICSTARKVVPAAAMVGVWVGLSAWFLPHYVNGFPLIIDLDHLTD